MLSSYAEMENAVGNEEWKRINQPEVRKRVQNRLSQRRHSEYPKASRSLVTLHPPTKCFTQGEKIRQQREPATQEILIPPSFTSPYTMEGVPEPGDYPSPSLSFNGQDERMSFSRSNQPQEGYEAFDGFSAPDMLSPDQTVSNAMAQNAQPGSMGTSRSMTPHMGRPVMNNSFQSNNMRAPGPLASGTSSLTAESRPEYWDSQSLSDSQWTASGFHQNSVPVACRPASTTDPRPASQHTHRTMTRPITRRISNASSNQQMNALSSPQASESYSSPFLQGNTASQTYPRSSICVEAADTKSDSNRNGHDTCSHCRTCLATTSFDDQKPGRTSPKTSTSTPSQDSSHASSPDHHEILANCSRVLADLAHQSDSRDENEPEQRHRTNKRNKRDLEGYFVDSGGSSQESGYEDGHRRHNFVEKVVILCVKDGRKIKGR